MTRSASDSAAGEWRRCPTSARSIPSVRPTLYLIGPQLFVKAFVWRQDMHSASVLGTGLPKYEV